MSEAEQFEAQGRKYAELRAARSRAATLRVSLEEHERRLQEAMQAVHQFLQGK